MAAPDLVIFDCDGVLIDSEVIACRADAACFAEIGIAISAEEIMQRYVGVSARTMFADIEARYGCRLPADFAQVLRTRIAAAFESELRAMPGIETALARVPSRTCVASSSSLDRLRHALSLVGLFERFDPHIFSANQVAHGKPAPDLFLFAARSMTVAPEQCVVIEDSVAGVQAGVAAGMRVLGFTGGSHCGAQHAEWLRTAGAQAIFTDMRAFPALLG